MSELHLMRMIILYFVTSDIEAVDTVIVLVLKFFLFLLFFKLRCPSPAQMSFLLVRLKLNV